ncbi:hypothetical protein GQ600_17514 [Phytophthora cactorum]|nr:hypothetical protein GQ600_17514 [Phytophthora cactorum]
MQSLDTSSTIMVFRFTPTQDYTRSLEPSQNRFKASKQKYRGASGVEECFMRQCAEPLLRCRWTRARLYQARAPHQDDKAEKSCPNREKKLI